MNMSRQAGYVSGVVISLVITIVLLAAALGFGGWAFMSRQDYKNNTDQKIAVAVAADQKATQAADAVKYAEAAKYPLKSHVGPSQYGSVTVQYPKTWSGYVKEDGNDSLPVDDYFQPDVVPDTGNNNNAYALRIQIIGSTYDSVLQQYQGAVKAGTLKAAPYSLPKVASVVGTKFDGQLDQNTQGSMTILPLRNVTLAVWTEMPSLLPDFNNIILPNLTFSP